MIHTGSFARLKAAFVAQFEPDGQGFLYRRNRTGPAVRLNAEEHADFVSGFARSLRLAGWAVFGTTVFVGLTAGVWSAWAGTDVRPWAPLGVGVLLLAFALIVLWLWNAPARQLAYRVPTAPGLSRDERRRQALARINYGVLAMGLLAVPFMLWNASRAWDILHGWGRLWIVAGVALFVLIAVQAFRKWRYERAGR